jgi:anti-sigma factor RsiW
MTKCTELEIQEMLPDLLHRSLDINGLSRVEAHLATCESCIEELKVLRMVAGAAVFAPSIDNDQIVRQIPPYRMPVQPPRVPARSRVVSWVVAASMLIVIAGGGSLLLAPRNQTRVALRPSVEQSTRSAAITAPPAAHLPDEQSTTVASVEQPAQVLAVGGVDGLSDGDLRQLMDDMNTFDALPAPEPEPVISIDATDTLDQGE